MVIARLVLQKTDCRVFQSGCAYFVMFGKGFQLVGSTDISGGEESMQMSGVRKCITSSWDCILLKVLYIASMEPGFN